MALGFKEVGEIIRLLDQSTLDEIVIDVGDLRVEVRRRGAVPPPAPVAAGTAPVAPAAEAPVAPKPAPAPAAAEGTEVRSPMVGTFYRRPGPGKAPFVDVGQRVEAGDPLCLVEVMKLFTTIAAPCAGTVLEIAVDDGGMVEYDQLMFRIAPA